MTKAICRLVSAVGPAASLPVSSWETRLDVDEAELGRGFAGSLPTLAAGTRVSTCGEKGPRHGAPG